MESKDKQERLRYKLVNNELNPIVDAALTIFLFAISPLLWFFSQIHDKLMFKFLNKTYIYNVSWEDPRMDHRVFNLNESDHIITIASAGCNVLDYIIEGAKVTAVDFNSCQIALTELKKVSILNLTYEEFFKIFSHSDMKLLQSVYVEKLRPHLSKPSREFWDEGIYRIKSFMYSGTSGTMSWVLFRIIFPLIGLGFIRTDLEKGTTKEELQEKIAKNSYIIRLTAWAMDNVFLRGGCCFAGVPERQMALGLHRPNNLAIVIERIFFKTDLVNDNYFYSGYILGYYKENNCPRYLRRENFEKLKTYLAKGNLKLVHGTMLQAIEETTEPLTVASLLDHMDWMTDSMINEEISALVKKLDPVKGKIFWRSFADDVHAAPLFWLNPTKVDDSDDRVGMYWSTWIAHLKDSNISYVPRIVTNQDKGLVANLITGAKMVTFPFWKPFIASTLPNQGHAKDMESFYKYQKEGYDAFREGLLHGRPALLEAFPLRKNEKMVWADIGAGTARNLEFFSSETIRKHFSKIYIVDISASLLEIAKRRVKLMDLEDIIEVIEHDVTSPTLIAKLGEAGSLDIVTMSYSYTMIPDRAATMKNIKTLLKSGGFLGVTDFFLNSKYDHCLSPFFKKLRKIESWVHKTWFSFDHVHLLGDNDISCYADDVLETIWDNRFRGGIPFLPFLVPYHGVYIMKKK